MNDTDEKFKEKNMNLDAFSFQENRMIKAQKQTDNISEPS
jgi:hypothetical protein